MTLDGIEERLLGALAELPKKDIGVSGNFLRKALLLDDDYENFTKSYSNLMPTFEHESMNLGSVSPPLLHSERIEASLRVIYYFSKASERCSILAETDIPYLLLAIIAKFPTDHSYSKLVLKSLQNLSVFNGSHRIFEGIPCRVKDFCQRFLVRYEALCRPDFPDKQ